ncbi:MAG: hypothetical protein ABR575_05905 [Actinomycetota bacterium]
MTAASPRLEAFSAGARAAGSVLCLGYLLGLVDGPLVGVLGGLALMTLGSGCVRSREDRGVTLGALAVAAIALGIGALRWGSVALAEIKGAQAVLGPGVVVGPPLLALASGLAGAASLVAAAVWVAGNVPPDRGESGPIQADAVLVALALVTVFWPPAAGSPGAGAHLAAFALWVGLTGVVALSISAAARRTARAPDGWRWAAVLGAATCCAAAIVLSSVAG